MSRPALTLLLEDHLRRAWLRSLVNPQMALFFCTPHRAQGDKEALSWPLMHTWSAGCYSCIHHGSPSGREAARLPPLPE